MTDKLKESNRPCDNCGSFLWSRGRSRRLECLDGCAVYNASVAAQGAAALALARSRYPLAAEAYLNEYGIWARVGEVTKLVGSPEEAAAFVALTTLAFRVRKFWRQETAKPKARKRVKRV